MAKKCFSDETVELPNGAQAYFSRNKKTLDASKSYCSGKLKSQLAVLRDEETLKQLIDKISSCDTKFWRIGLSRHQHEAYSWADGTRYSGEKIEYEPSILAEKLNIQNCRGSLLDVERSRFVYTGCDVKIPFICLKQPPEVTSDPDTENLIPRTSVDGRGVVDKTDDMSGGSVKNNTDPGGNPLNGGLAAGFIIVSLLLLFIVLALILHWRRKRKGPTFRSSTINNQKISFHNVTNFYVRHMRRKKRRKTSTALRTTELYEPPSSPPPVQCIVELESQSESCTRRVSLDNMNDGTVSIDSFSSSEWDDSDFGSESGGYKIKEEPIYCEIPTPNPTLLDEVTKPDDGPPSICDIEQQDNLKSDNETDKTKSLEDKVEPPENKGKVSEEKKELPSQGNAEPDAKTSNGKTETRSNVRLSRKISVKPPRPTRCPPPPPIISKSTLD